MEKFGEKKNSPDETSLEEKDRRAREMYPVGSKVTIKETGEKGTVRRYVTSKLYGLKWRKEPYVVIENEQRVLKDYALDELSSAN